MNDLDFPDLCLIYPVTVDDYGQSILGPASTVPCLYEQTTGYQHAGSQDAITSSSRLALPGDNAFVTSHAYRLEEMIVVVNPFGSPAGKQQFKITAVTPARDVLLDNQVRHVECDLKKVQTEGYVS